MACLKCGSDWVTRWGKDKLSCPECCKQQRCKARKLGHLAAVKTKTCERCGVQFEAVGGNAIARMRCCRECQQAKDTSRERQKRHQQRVRDGIVIRKKREQKPPRSCLRCEKVLGPNQIKYCSNDCFIAHRNDGQQEWDRTNQLAANERRCGVSTTPSRVGLRQVLNGFAGFMSKLRAFRKRVSRLHCPVCDALVERARSRFCSDECARQFGFLTSCKHCGCETHATGYRGSSRRACAECKKRIEKEGNRRAKRRYGRNYRDRARYHGVNYVAFPVRDIYERDGYRCQICSKRVFRKARYRKRDGKIHPLSPTIDHIVPMCRGGNHEPSNCQTACFMCNSKKGASGGGQLRLVIASQSPR